MFQREADVTLTWLYETLDTYGTWKKAENGDITFDGSFLGNEGFFLLCKKEAVLRRIKQITSHAEVPTVTGGSFAVSPEHATDVLSTILDDAFKHMGE